MHCSAHLVVPSYAVTDGPVSAPTACFKAGKAGRGFGIELQHLRIEQAGSVAADTGAGLKGLKDLSFRGRLLLPAVAATVAHVIAEAESGAKTETENGREREGTARIANEDSNLVVKGMHDVAPEAENGTETESENSTKL